jgi:hypothetical protein
MESLVHYQTMLVQRHNAALGDEECERLKASSLELLQQLEAQDPLRKQRYRDIGQCSVHHNPYHSRRKETCLIIYFLGVQHHPSHQINDVDYYSGCLISLQGGDQTDAG